MASLTALRLDRTALLHGAKARGRLAAAPDLPPQEGSEAWQRKAEDIEEAQRLGRPLTTPTQALRRTLAQEWPAFVERRTAEVAPSTIDKHQWVYRAWIEPVLGNRKLGTIAPEDPRALLEDAKTAGKGVDTRIAIYQTVNMLLDTALGRRRPRTRPRCHEPQVVVQQRRLQLR